jgi:hypothetical protein
MKMVIFRRMYDPLARKQWVESFVLEGNSLAELDAEYARLDARHRKWTGNGAEGEGSC